MSARSSARSSARNLLLTLFALAPPVAAQHVANPKASVVDVPARIAALQSTQDPLLRGIVKSLGSCLKLPPIAPPTGPMEIPHHYLVASNGPTNPAEAAATVLYNAFEHRITAGMNQYLATGSEPEATCALAQLDSWAQAKTLSDYDKKAFSQSWFQAEWSLCSAGVTYSVLVNDTHLDPAQLQRVGIWLNTAAHRLISLEKPGEEGNNHHYWRALAATSIGVATADDALFTFGLTVYKQAIGQLDTRGAFPLEMARHENAVHYQGFALQPLVVIAQFAHRQHIDAYGFTANGQSLATAIDFFGRAAADPTLVKPYTTDVQKDKFSPGDFAPFLFFAVRYPTRPLPPAIAAGLRERGITTRTGGEMHILATVN